MDEQEEAYHLSRVPKQQGSKLHATKVSSVLQKVIQQRGYAAVQSMDRLRSVWEEIVGSKLAGQTSVGKISRGQLAIAASNEVVATELQFMQSQILRGLKDKCPEFSIRGLKVRIDGVR